MVERVDAAGGRVKIGGEIWSARAFDADAGARARHAGRGCPNRRRDRARLRIGDRNGAADRHRSRRRARARRRSRARSGSSRRPAPAWSSGSAATTARCCPGLAIVVPFVDRLRPLIDLREQVVSFPPQPVITEDNLVVSIDSVIYFQVTDAKAATYEIANYIQAIEQLTVTTLRNVIGGMELEKTLTSRDEINDQLRGVLDEATGKWGIRVNRVELKAIDPPPSIQETMEKQMRADREKRAAILTAEGVKQSQILTAEGEKQAAILKAEGARQAMILTAEGQARRSRRSSRRSTTATPTRSCSPTSTCRCCRRSRRATPTRCGSSRASSRKALERIGDLGKADERPNTRLTAASAGSRDHETNGGLLKKLIVIAAAAIGSVVLGGASPAARRQVARRFCPLRRIRSGPPWPSCSRRSRRVTSRSSPEPHRASDPSRGPEATRACGTGVSASHRRRLGASAIAAPECEPVRARVLRRPHQGRLPDLADRALTLLDSGR